MAKAIIRRIKRAPMPKPADFAQLEADKVLWEKLDALYRQFKAESARLVAEHIASTSVGETPDER